MKILLVEDDTFASELLSSLLKNCHYTVDLATDGQVGFDLAEQEDYDLILLDIQLPKLDGLSMCRQLRNRGCNVPILMLTARDSNNDVVTGLNAGADDYVVKPYDPAQLAARIRSLLRRGQQPLQSPIFQWGDLKLDTMAAEVFYQSRRVLLSPKEYKLLAFLMQHPQQVFSRQAVIDHLYSLDDSPSNATVTNLVKDLRRKLKTAGLTEEVVETVYGLGYRLKAAPEPTTPRAVEEADNAQEQQIVERFRACLEERVVAIDQALGALETGELDDQQRQGAIAQAHQLAGTLGMFGASGATDLMQTVEQVLMGPGQDADFLVQISQLRSNLREIPAYCFDLPTPTRVG